MGRATEKDRGATLVEFAFVMIPLFFLVFGIIIFGILLSYDQKLTEAAADGVRSAAYVLPGDINPADGVDDRINVAMDSVERGVNAYDRSCHDPADGLTCTATIVADCDGEVGKECIEVRIVFDNTGDTALLPAIPLIQYAVPDELSARSVVESLAP